MLHQKNKTTAKLANIIIFQYFEKFLTTDKVGIIYFTMGSVLLSESMPSATIQTIFDVFSELPYQILWKINKENLPKGLNIPANIHFESWMPQLDLLCKHQVELLIIKSE